MIEIKIQIRDRETLSGYNGVHHDLIVQDFLDNPHAWLKFEDTTITVSRKTKRGKKEKNLKLKVTQT